MRPITLTISAFGPYADQTVLNFDALGLQRLFVITGPTGAGKTTVFEAILYALYGKLSKKGMDPASLRCDFLKPDDDILTFVEFIFEIGNKQYRIRRQPKQWVAKKRGDGRREVGQEVVLECVGHTDFLPLTKISEVDTKIVELIGLEEEQFKKIVMLPQGAFQEFLISGTKEKSELLRNIFNTSLYDLALQRLKGRVSKMSGDYERVRMQYQAQCAMLKTDKVLTYGEFPSDEEVACLDCTVKDEENKIADFTEKVQKADVAYKMAIDAFNTQKQHNEDVRLWQDAVAQKAVLEQRGDAIRVMKERIKEAEKAEAVAAKEDRFLEAKSQLNVLQQALTDTEADCQRLNEQSKVVKERHQKALLEKQEADKAFQKVPELSNKLAHLQQYMKKKADLAIAQRTAQDMQKKQCVAQEALNRLSEKVKGAEEAVEKQQGLQTAHSKKQVLLVQLKQTLQEDRVNFKSTATALERYKRLQTALKDEAKAEAVLAQKEEALQEAREKNRQHEAALLAVGLEDGMPCPVCGAIHHPNLAQGSGAHAEEDALLVARDEAQKDYLRAQASTEQLKSLLQRDMEELHVLNADLEDIDEVQRYQNVLKERGVQNKQQYEQLKQEVDAVAQELVTYEAQGSKLATLKQEQATLQQEYTEAATQAGQAQGMLEQTRAEVQALEAVEGFSGDEEITSLSDSIEAIKQQHQRADDAFNEAQEAHARLLIDQASAESALAEKKAHLINHEHTVKTLEGTFTEAREAVFADDRCYFAAKKDIAEKNLLQQEIERYNQAWTQAVTTCRMLEERLQEQKTLVDLHALEAECKMWQAKVEEANTLLSEQKARCKSNASIMKDIQNLLTQFKALENDYAVLGQLRDVLDGKNRFNMRFEIFAQAYYFESMLEHANARLARMTHGRYSFRRKESVRDGRKQAGLDLDVMDQYTGRARDVATLSGGESFKASLSLALGLADVVTGESGGVELSTIFIDEGFGTLDDESLDDTVETLLQLQDSGRLVGVISHVAELKERIPAHLVVTSGKRGSHAHFEVRE